MAPDKETQEPSIYSQSPSGVVRPGLGDCTSWMPSKNPLGRALALG
jgi:hypothetical protein